MFSPEWFLGCWSVAIEGDVAELVSFLFSLFSFNHHLPFLSSSRSCPHLVPVFSAQSSLWFSPQSLLCFLVLPSYSFAHSAPPISRLKIASNQHSQLITGISIASILQKELCVWALLVKPEVCSFITPTLE